MQPFGIPTIADYRIGMRYAPGQEVPLMLKGMEVA